LAVLSIMSFFSILCPARTDLAKTMCVLARRFQTGLEKDGRRHLGKYAQPHFLLPSKMGVNRQYQVKTPKSKCEVA